MSFLESHSFYSKLNADDLFIKCGEWDTQQENEPKAQQTRQVKQISIHPAFKRRGVHNDLALLHVNSSFELDDHINPICLPTSKVAKKISYCLLEIFIIIVNKIKSIN